MREEMGKEELQQPESSPIIIQNTEAGGRQSSFHIPCMDKKIAENWQGKAGQVHSVH